MGSDAGHFFLIGKRNSLVPLGGKELVLEVLEIWIHYRLSIFPSFFRMIYISLGGMPLIFVPSLNLLTSCPINQLFQALVGISFFLFFLFLSLPTLLFFVGSSRLDV